MDKSWIDFRNRCSKEYINGIEGFLNYAYANKNIETTKIYCPCKRCANRVYHARQTVRDHLEMHGFDKTYKVWIFHGETFGGVGSNINTLGMIC